MMLTVAISQQPLSMTVAEDIVQTMVTDQTADSAFDVQEYRCSALSGGAFKILQVDRIKIITHGISGL